MWSTIFKFRVFAARTIAPVLALTGYRFSQDYRQGKTLWHRAVYSICLTFTANIKADELAYFLTFKN